jgi:hypothetical protein
MEANISNDRRQMRRELLIYAVMQLVCFGVMLGVYALLRRLTGKVILGGAVGAGLAILNYCLMAVGVTRAANQAEGGDVARAKRTITASMLLRYLLMLGVLVLCAKLKWCDVVAMLIPLLLSRLLIFAGEFFRRKKADQ